MNTLALLTLALGETEITLGNGPEEKKASGEDSRGVVSSILAKRLYEVKNMLLAELVQADEDHKALHADGRGAKPGRHSCMAFIKAMEDGSKRLETLDSLQWKAIMAESAAIMVNGVSLRKRWQLTSKGKWDNTILFPDTSSITYSVVDDLRDVILGRGPQIVKEDPTFTEPGKEEVILGTITDTKILGLWALMDEIIDEHKASMPPGFQEDFKQVSGKMTVNEVRRIVRALKYLADLKSLISSIFWAVVRESIPSAAEAGGIGIRKGWQVVSIPEEEDSLDILHSIGMGALHLGGFVVEVRGRSVAS